MRQAQEVFSTDEKAKEHFIEKGAQIAKVFLDEIAAKVEFEKAPTEGDKQAFVAAQKLRSERSPWSIRVEDDRLDSLKSGKTNPVFKAPIHPFLFACCCLEINDTAPGLMLADKKTPAAFREGEGLSCANPIPVWLYFMGCLGIEGETPKPPRRMGTVKVKVNPTVVGSINSDPIRPGVIEDQPNTKAAENEFYTKWIVLEYPYEFNVPKREMTCCLPCGGRTFMCLDFNDPFDQMCYFLLCLGLNTVGGTIFFWANNLSTQLIATTEALKAGAMGGLVSAPQSALFGRIGCVVTDTCRSDGGNCCSPCLPAPKLSISAD